VGAIGGVVPVTFVCGALNTKPVARMSGLTEERRMRSFQASALAMVWFTATMLERHGSTRAGPPT
jgi:apolipoprotein N-acyltransferase